MLDAGDHVDGHRSHYVTRADQWRDVLGWQPADGTVVWHALTVDDVARGLDTSTRGLDDGEVTRVT